ncbi:MAG TPA: DUF3185 family protein [Phycisphaerales bacterium]|nr:DUF3185 family protein [Phycisphaerales bacterium]
MNPNRIIAVILLFAGVALFIVGMNSSDSVADRLSNTFTGRFTDATNWYIFGGIALAVLGLGLGAMGWRRKSA